MFKKHKHKKIILAEILVVVASVLIWRSYWHLLDRVSFADEPVVLVITMVLGFLLLIPSLRYIINREH